MAHSYLFFSQELGVPGGRGGGVWGDKWLVVEPFWEAESSSIWWSSGGVAGKAWGCSI